MSEMVWKLALRVKQALRVKPALLQEQLASPVLTLPTEIIMEVFIHFLPVYPACPPLTGTHSPTNLTQICRKWREIALATPMLWRAIDLAWDKADFAQFALWFGRSGRLPISLVIGGGQIQFSTAQSARWEAVKLFSSPSLGRQRFVPLPGSLPLLRHLHVTNTVGTGIILFGEAPLLRSVTIDYADATRVVLPWGQITSLTLRGVAGRECLPVLRQTPNLVHCSWTTYYNDRVNVPDVKLLALESLIHVGGYLHSFFIPALRELQITEAFTPRGLILDRLTAFISKSGCKLEKICISGPRYISKDTYRRSFPSVQFLFEGKYVGAVDPNSAYSLD
ncbi:hypothetical protein C8R46DRAFT_1357127 [Mycena filopes]|nr:hypothetical protein C8R46DRAFT_1357127 [Mycena filopes]